MVLNFKMFPPPIFEINSLVNTDEGQRIVVGYAYVEGEIIYVLANDTTYEDEDLFYKEAKDIKLISLPKTKFITKYQMGDRADATEYVGGILKESRSDDVLYFLTNTEFEPETIQWIELQ